MAVSDGYGLLSSATGLARHRSHEGETSKLFRMVAVTEKNP